MVNITIPPPREMTISTNISIGDVVAPGLQFEPFSTIRLLKKELAYYGYLEKRLERWNDLETMDIWVRITGIIGKEIE